MSEFEKAQKNIFLPSDFPDNEKDWNQFYVDDVFNPGNKLTGFLCMRPTRYYGAMIITHVNNDYVPQLIFCVPKLHYPFDKNGNYHFPKAKKIEVYDKIDGTSIFAYKYRSNKGEFFTYKLRVNPIVPNSKWGPFRDMLFEIMDRKKIEHAMVSNSINLAFELWGSRNKHLIVYDRPLALTLLFGVDLNGRVRPPSEIIYDGEVAKSFGGVKGNFVENYNWHRQQDNDSLKIVEGGYKGTEGRVWYMFTDRNEWVMMKCKPSQIEEIHWANTGLSNNIIKATAMNVLETDDEITVKGVKQLLLEEFQDIEVDEATDRIIQVIEEINTEMAYIAKILEEYDKIGIDIRKDKAGAMRALSGKFERRSMGLVYSTIINHR